MSTPFEDQEQDELLLSRGIVRTPTGGYMRVPYTSIQYWRNDPIPTPDLAPQAPAGPDPEEGVRFSDYARSIMSGGAQVAQGVGWLTRQLGFNDVGRAIEELGANAVDYWNEGLSDAAKDALSREFIRKNELGEWEWGDANLNTVGLFGAQSLLGTAAGAGVGAGITKVLQVFANPVGRAALTQAVQKGSMAIKAAQAGDPAAIAIVRTGQAAAKKLGLIDKVIGAAGFGIGEGSIGGMSAGVNVYESVMSLPAEKIASNPRYQEVFNSTDETMPYLERHQYAAETVAREASSLAGYQSGLTTALLGAPMGAFFGSILGKRALGALAGSTPRAITTGALGEAAQEFLQSGAEQVISNRTLQRVGDDEVDLFDDVLNQAIGGALAGAPLGAAFGATDVQREQPVKQSPKKGATEPAPKLEPLRTAAKEAFAAGVPQEEILQTVDRVKSGEEPVLVAIGKLRKRQMGFVSPGEAQPTQPATPATPEAQAAQSTPAPAQPQQNLEREQSGRALPQAVAVGAETMVAGEKPVRTQYQLVDVNTLVTSHDIEGRANAAFPQELQPRDRSRSASRQWIEETTARFQHEPMIEGVDAGGGPPIVDADGIVESGNGRANLLRNVYAKNKAGGKAYKAYLAAHAERFGIDPAAVEQLDTPILVRVRQDPMEISERVAFTQAANRPAVAALAPAERARADAVNLDDAQLSRLNVPDDGNVLAASNAQFVQSFLQGLPATERGGLLTSEGEPTKQVADRIKAALFAKAYDDDRLLALAAEEADPDVANVVNALVRAAPAFAKVRDSGIDITGPLLEGVEVLRAARKAGQSVDEYLRQQGLFSNASPEAGRVAQFLSKNIRSAKRMSEALTEVANYIEQASNPTGDLLGDPLPRTLTAALDAANQRMLERNPERITQSALFARPAEQTVTDQIPDAELFGGNPDLPPTERGAPDFGRPAAPAGTARNAIPSQLTQRQKAQLLAEMAVENRPVAQQMMERVLATIDGRGYFKINTKSEKSLIGKANRPGILAKRPWWNVEHVADSFRFKLVLDNWSDLPTVVESITAQARSAGVLVEKADFGKFWSERGLGAQPAVSRSTAGDLAPVDLWGWRMVPFDLRMPNGQLAEFYVTLREMDVAQEDKGHDLFEKWRFKDAKQILKSGGAELKRFLFDARISRLNYDTAVRDYLKRENQTPSELLASFKAAETAASSMMGAKSFVRSSIVEPSGSMASRSVDQSPPSPRQATRSGETRSVSPLPSLDLSNIEPSVTESPPSVTSLTDDRFGVMSLRRMLKPAIDELSPIINVSVEDSPAKYGLDSRVQGAFLTRASGRQEVVLFAQPISLALTGAPNAFARAREIITHEVFGHFALERTPWGKESVDMVLQLHERQHASIEPLWEEVKKRYGYITQEEHAKEVIALMAERGIKHATMTRLMAAVRRFLRKLGIVRDYSDAEVRDLILRAARALRTDVNKALADSPKLKALTPQSSDAEILAAIDEAIPPGVVEIDRHLDSKVFHGSPHDFDEFSLQNIGTGEGVQAYGWGLYFAENPNVAGSYRRGMGSALAWNGKPLTFIQPEQVQWMTQTQRQALAMLRDEANIADARHNIKSGAYADRVGPEAAAEAQRMIDSGEVTERPRGPLYEAEIPDEEVAKFLDRDAPLSQQPQAVRDALARMHPELYGAEAEDFELDLNEPGEMIYERLADLHGGPQGASLALAAEGIKGLKYFDEGSRSLGDKAEQMIREHGGLEQAKDFVRSMLTKAEREHGRGSIHARAWQENLKQLSKGVTRNLVVFDDSIVKVANKVLFSRAAPADPEIQAIMDRVLTKAPEEFTLKDKVRNLWSGVRNTQGLAVKQGFIDQFASIEALEREFTGGALLDASESAYKAALATKNLSSVMAATMMVGVPEYKNGAYVPVAGRKGVIDIFKPLTEHKDGNLLRQWELFAAANRANRLIKEKNKDGTRRENLFTQEEIDTALKLEQKYPVFRQVLNDWNTFNKQMLDLAQDAGVLDPIARATWEKNDYVPFYRAIEDIQAPRGKKGFSGQRAKIGTLKGGTEQLGNIFENMMLNTAHLLDASFKNRAMQRIVGLGIGTALEPVPFDHEAIKFTDDQLARALTNAGLIVGNLSTGLGGLQVVQQMTPQQKAHWSTLFRRVAPKGKGIVSVMVDGKPEYYEVTDPLLLSSITGMGHDNFADVWGLFRGSKRLLTGAITADPAFMLANFVRDTLSTWVVSDASMHPFVDAVKGIKAALTNDPAMIEIMMAGAGGGGYYDSAPEDVRKLIANKVPAGASKGLSDTVVNTPRKAWRAWQKIGSAAENANRIAIFKAVVASGGSKAEAAYQARDVLNFTMSGDYAAMRWLTQTVPFMNARIQGLYRLYRGARDNKRAFALKGMMLLAATMALALKNNDDERYEELPEWDKDTYWHIFAGDEHFRIPKPFEVGAMFATIPERMFRSITGRDSHKILGKQMMQMFADTFAFNPVPQLVKPVVEQYANRSMFTGSPIVGMAEQRLQPEAQFTPWTSATMRELAEAMPDFAPEWLRSPRRLEAALRAYTGTLGMYVLGASDAIVRSALGYPENPQRKIYDYPVVSRFLKDPNPRHTKYSDLLYEMLDEANAVHSTINRLRRERQFEQARELQQANRDKLAVRVRLNRIATNVRNINAQIRLIQHSKTLNPTQKRERIDALVERKNKLTRQVDRFADLF